MWINIFKTYFFRRFRYFLCRVKQKVRWIKKNISALKANITQKNNFYCLFFLQCAKKCALLRFFLYLIRRNQISKKLTKQFCLHLQGDYKASLWNFRKRKSTGQNHFKICINAFEPMEFSLVQKKKLKISSFLEEREGRGKLKMRKG